MVRAGPIHLDRPARRVAAPGGAPGPGPTGNRRRRWLYAGAVALAAAVVAGLIAYAVTPRPSAVIGPEASRAARGVGAGLPELAAGHRAPSFSLPRLGGGPPVGLPSHPGRPVVVNFFASWCSDCRAELTAFATVSAARSPGVTFVGVDVNDHDPAKATALLSAAGDRYPVGVDPDASVANGKYLVEALPATVFVTPGGRIAAEVFGAQTVASLDSHIRALTARRR